MKRKLSPRFWTSLAIFSLVGQIAWVVENMYLNVFIYKMFGATPGDISLMVALSAVSATLTTVFIGALADKLGKRRAFISGGYILWGISILGFALLKRELIGALFPGAVSVSAVCVTLVIILDCLMTFFGSSANDAAFNAWLTDSTSDENRGAAEGINAMMPLVAILAVFGGFMAFDLDRSESWSAIFIIIGITVIAVGVLGIFIIDEPDITPSGEPYFGTLVFGFRPSSVKANPSLYLHLLLFIVFNISIQIFMPYLIIYYEVTLGMSNYVLVMAPAIVIASVVAALFGKLYDRRGFAFAAPIATAALALGFIILYFFVDTAPVFIGSLLMMSGYLSGMAVFGAKIRDLTPEGRAGMLQGVRIFSQVLVPGVVGPFIGKLVLADAEMMVNSDGTESFIPEREIFLAALIPAALIILALAVLHLLKRKERV